MVNSQWTKLKTGTTKELPSCLRVDSSPSGQHGHHFTDDIIRCIFMNETFGIFIQFSLKSVPKGPIDNKAALIWVMAWHQIGNKPLPELMLTQFTDTYATLGGDKLMPYMNRKSLWLLMRKHMLMPYWLIKPHKLLSIYIYLCFFVNLVLEYLWTGIYGIDDQCFKLKFSLSRPEKLENFPPYIIYYNFYLTRVKFNWSSPIFGHQGQPLVLNTGRHQFICVKCVYPSYQNVYAHTYTHRA